MCMSIAPNPQPKNQTPQRCSHTDHLIDYKQQMLSFTTDDYKWDKYTHFCKAVLCVADINVCGMDDVYMWVCVHVCVFSWLGLAASCARWLLQQTETYNWQHNSEEKEQTWRASLVVQWLRIRLPMQRTRVQALGREDPTCRGAINKPVCHNYWACALEPVSHNYRSPRA